MKTQFLGKHEVAKNIYEFTFSKPKNFTFQAGQFIELIVPHNSPDNRGQKRWFTLSSAPSRSAITITTKLATKPSTFKQELFESSTGSLFPISHSMGDFVLPRDQSKPLLFVAGGIGITPFKSMCDSLSANHQRNIFLLYGASNGHFPYLDSLASKCSKIITTTNRLTPKVVSELISKISKPTVYISGPEAMVDVLYGDLKEQYDQSRLLRDSFPNYSAAN